MPDFFCRLCLHTVSRRAPTSAAGASLLQWLRQLGRRSLGCEGQPSLRKRQLQSRKVLWRTPPVWTLLHRPWIGLNAAEMSNPKQGTDHKTHGLCTVCLAMGTSGAAVTRANALSSRGCFKSRRLFPHNATHVCNAQSRKRKLKRSSAVRGSSNINYKDIQRLQQSELAQSGTQL